MLSHWKKIQISRVINLSLKMKLQFAAVGTVTISTLLIVDTAHKLCDKEI